MSSTVAVFKTCYKHPACVTTVTPAVSVSARTGEREGRRRGRHGKQELKCWLWHVSVPLTQEPISWEPASVAFTVKGPLLWEPGGGDSSRAALYIGGTNPQEQDRQLGGRGGSAVVFYSHKQYGCSLCDIYIKCCRTLLSQTGTTCNLGPPTRIIPQHFDALICKTLCKVVHIHTHKTHLHNLHTHTPP